MAEAEGNPMLPVISCLLEHEHSQKVTRKQPLTSGTNASQTVRQGSEEKSQPDSEKLLKIRTPRPSPFSVLRKAARRTYFPERILLQVTDTRTSESSSSPGQSMSFTESNSEGWHEDLQLGIEILSAIQIIGDQEEN
jgi:hypothetical protein